MNKAIREIRVQVIETKAIMQYGLKKNLTGAYTVKFKCPKCGLKLSESLENAGRQDACPECGQGFVVPGAEELERQRKAEAKLAEEKAAQKQSEAQKRARQKEQMLFEKAEAKAAKVREREQAIQLQREQREQMDRAKEIIKKQASSQIPNVLLLSFISLLLAAILGVQVVSVFQRRNAWEYMISAPSDINLQDSLDTFGENGWELVTARRATSSRSNEFSYECIFKRRK